MRRLRDLISEIGSERRVFAVLGVAAALITVVEYFLIPTSYERIFPHDESPLGVWTWWSSGQVLCWGLIPYLVGRWMGLTPRQLGLGFGSLGRWIPVFGVFYLLMLGPLVWASRQTGFQDAYPLVSTEDWRWSVLLRYWVFGTLLLMTAEFMFRGFLLFPLERRFGYASIAVMMVPYCMIHYHKPFPEALGSIVAGVILGWLALKTRSIWGGVILHVSIAITLEILVMMFGDLGFPKGW